MYAVNCQASFRFTRKTHKSQQTKYRKSASGLLKSYNGTKYSTHRRQLANFTCNSTQPVALTAEMLLPVLCFFLPFSATKYSLYMEGPSSPTRRSGTSPVLPGLEEKEEKGLSSHRRESCSLQKLDLDANPNVNRAGRGKKASVKYKAVREENETWCFPLSWLDRGVNHLHGKYPSAKGLAQLLPPCTEWLMSSWEPPDTPRTGVKLPPQPHANTPLYTDTQCSLFGNHSSSSKILLRKMRARPTKIKHSAAQTIISL